MEEQVSHPKHYTFSKYEVLDVASQLEMMFAEGNVLKYIARSDFKNQKLTDLKKALFCLEYCLKNKLMYWQRHSMWFRKMCRNIFMYFPKSDFLMRDLYCHLVLSDWEKHLKADELRVISMIMYGRYDDAKNALNNLINKLANEKSTN